MSIALVLIVILVVVVILVLFNRYVVWAQPWKNTFNVAVILLFLLWFLWQIGAFSNLRI